MSHQTLGLAEQDVPGGTVLRIVTTGWDIGLRVNRGPEGQIDSAFVERIAHDDDPRRAALLARMRESMTKNAEGDAKSDSDASLRAELKRLGRSVMSKEKRRQFRHVQKTLKQHGPVSLAVLNVRSAACFGRTVGADGTPGTGEVVGRACPRMVMRRGKPRCGACGCPSTPLSDLRNVIRSPGWGCGEEKMGKYAAMVPFQGHPAEAMKPNSEHPGSESRQPPAAGTLKESSHV